MLLLHPMQKYGSGGDVKSRVIFDFDSSPMLTYSHLVLCPRPVVMALGMFHKKGGVRTKKGWFSDWSISPNYTDIRGEAADSRDFRCAYISNETCSLGVLPNQAGTE